MKLEELAKASSEHQDTLSGFEAKAGILEQQVTTAVTGVNIRVDAAGHAFVDLKNKGEGLTNNAVNASSGLEGLKSQVSRDRVCKRVG